MFPSCKCVALCCVVVFADFVSGYIVDITNNGPVVQGATIQFKVEVFDNSGRPAEGTFIYYWNDVRFPENNATFEITSHISVWNLTCNSKYTPGEYKVHLLIEEKYSIIVMHLKKTITNKTMPYEVTKLLNGEMVLSQGNVTRKRYINSAVLLNQTVTLSSPDLDYVNASKTNVVSFWFVDCVYYGMTSGFRYDFNYSKPESKHLVQALIVATPVPVNFTLDAAPVIANVSDAATNTSAVAPTVSDADGRFKEWLVTYNRTHPRGNSTTVQSLGTCLNISSVPLNDNYTYGLFSTNFTVKEPVKVSPINGTSWLKDGEILNITVSCTGSSPFKYCIWIRQGLYNVTGNEVCEEELLIKNCSFNIQHLFRQSTEYTVVVFLSNSVSQVIKPIAVNIYKVTKHPQLSVIIVPVAFSIVAVILIIFGFAFYVQSKRSYTVEVADFDFANQSSDMEYKSFRERLRESVSNLFLKSNDFNDDEQVWSPTRKYGSMQ